MLEDIPQFPDAAGVEAVGRLVQNEYLGLVHQRLSKAYALLHAQGIPFDLIVDALGHADEGGHLVDASGIQLIVQPGIHFQVLSPA